MPEDAIEERWIKSSKSHACLKHIAEPGTINHLADGVKDILAPTPIPEMSMYHSNLACTVRK
eukprot:1694489-Amphidinium_carterae.1